MNWLTPFLLIPIVALFSAVAGFGLYAGFLLGVHRFGLPVPKIRVAVTSVCGTLNVIKERDSQ